MGIQQTYRIVATAREEKAIILTKDKRILNYSGVKSVW